MYHTVGLIRRRAREMGRLTRTSSRSAWASAKSCAEEVKNTGMGWKYRVAGPRWLVMWKGQRLGGQCYMPGENTARKIRLWTRYMIWRKQKSPRNKKAVQFTPKPLISRPIYNLFLFASVLRMPHLPCPWLFYPLSNQFLPLFHLSCLSLSASIASFAAVATCGCCCLMCSQREGRWHRR